MGFKANRWEIPGAFAGDPDPTKGSILIKREAEENRVHIVERLRITTRPATDILSWEIRDGADKLLDFGFGRVNEGDMALAAPMDRSVKALVICGIAGVEVRVTLAGVTLP